jgi:hypothetical protein
VLVTSRVPTPSLGEDWQIDLQPLTRDDALAMLASTVGHERVASE